MKKVIYLDMDGTLCDLYSYPNWKQALDTNNSKPYEVAKPLLNMSHFARTLNTIQKKGYKIGILSCLSINGTKEYHKRVDAVKRKWLKKHLPSVKFDTVKIIPYTHNKEQFANKNDILFDDSIDVRNNWKGKVFTQDNIIQNLKGLIK